MFHFRWSRWLPVSHLPKRPGWLLEPKYNGFRCIIFRDGENVDLRSRRQRPLARYFPEIVEAARELKVERYVLDGELVIPDQPFDVLQLRLHPAPSRVSKLSREHPAQFVAFDLLADEHGHSLLAQVPHHGRGGCLPKPPAPANAGRCHDSGCVPTPGVFQRLE